MGRDEARAFLGPEDGPGFQDAAGATGFAYVVGRYVWYPALVLEIEYDEVGRYRGHRLRRSWPRRW